MMEVLNNYSNFAVAFLTLLLVLVTIVYAVFTRQMVKEMQVTRQADLRPYLIIDTIIIGQMFYLVIKNNGKTAAERVGFKFDRSIENMWKKKIEELPLFKEGITFFPPGKEFVVTLGPTYLFLSNKKEEIKYPSNFTIIVKYSYFDKIKKTESTTINLEEYMDTRSYPNEIIKSLETLDGTLRKGLESIAKSAEKLSKIEAIASPSGLDISHSTVYRILEIFNENAKHKIKLNLNLATLSELVDFLEIETKTLEKILEKRYEKGYFESFDELKDVEGMTDELLEKLEKQTFICNPRF